MIKLILIFALLPTFAFAKMTCAPRPILTAALFKVGGLVPVVGGVSTQGTLVELFISPGRTWAIVETDAQGVSCTIRIGTGLESVAPVAVIVPQGVPG